MNATRGFLAKSWHNVACTQIQLPGPNGTVTNTCRNDGHQRTYQVVKALHNLVTSLWKGRNEELHRRDHEHEVFQRTVIDAEIARLHCDPSALPAEDQHYCNHTLAYILRKPPTYKRRWLFRVRAARERSKADQTRQQRITKFFHRTSNSQQNNSAHPTQTPAQARRDPTKRRPTSTTQQLLTAFLRERAPNNLIDSTPHTSPPPV